ncbi:putative late blight resistance protein homolog R1A-10 [Salvia miltiorrhiza]|uniref:putative late blight resistance protein homolog R1A-10 n=1 Tax=Salvia miltiorrhiza TaxID=226208 RepID=UPI0025ACA72B|nr:putative late blight resistance protein homolog R1A-10 [Salvia miltiorrhiza]
MTAYGAMNSLINTIDYILNSSHYSLVHHSPHIIQLAYDELEAWHDILKRLDGTSKSKSRKKVNDVDRRIKDLIWEFEDLLQSILYKQILSQVKDEGIVKEIVWIDLLLRSLPKFERQPRGRMYHCRTTHTTTRVLLNSRPPSDTTLLHFFTRISMMESEASRSRSLEGDVGGERMRVPIDLRDLQYYVCSFIEKLKNMEEEYVYAVDNMPEDEDDGDQSISSGSGSKSKLIGLSDQFQQLKRVCMGTAGVGNRTAVVGTAGVGKTALARAVFEDPEISSHFEHRAWVTLGRRSKLADALRGVLAQVFGTAQGDDELGAYLKERLEGKKCLIVLDDVWESEIWDSLLGFLDDKNDGSIRILATTRDQHTTDRAYVMLVRFLNEEESKELLCDKVFGEKICPIRLEKAATKIVKNCEGLPLTIVTVADILSKSKNRDLKYWDDVAEMRNSVFADAYNETSKVLFPSYDYLPQELKTPFLYLGVFPPDYDIPISKLMNMLAIEGWFHKRNKTLAMVWYCLEEFCTYKNLALSNQRSFYTKDVAYQRRCSYSPCRYGHLANSNQISIIPEDDFLWISKYKTCRLHSSWRHVCREEARKDKFYHILNKLVDGSEDGVKGQRCLCLENNILFSIKDFCNSVRLNCEFYTHSLLFFGPYHQYPIPVGNDFKLLGKLDALNLRFYTFPTDILTLVLLKYLALTCNGELPPTISKLFNLRILIIHPHNNIRIFGTPSYVPVQIWDMKELEHIEILGKSLVAPSHSASLKKLSTIVGVDASIFTILKLSYKVPYIKKLVVQTPYDDHHGLLSCFGCISTLGSLEILKFSIIDPEIKHDDAFSSALMFPRWTLKKLHLSGMGFSWEYMDEIGSLPSLEVLKLRAYAFQGPKWEARDGSFLKLKFLLIEDTDLVQWKPRYESFPHLACLSMKHCYELEEIHWPSHYRSGSIELVDCNPVALTCAEQLQPCRGTYLDVTASSSFGGKPITVKFRRYGAECRRVFE